MFLSWIYISAMLFIFCLVNSAEIVAFAVNRSMICCIVYIFCNKEIICNYSARGLVRLPIATSHQDCGGGRKFFEKKYDPFCQSSKSDGGDYFLKTRKQCFTEQMGKMKMKYCADFRTLVAGQ